MPRYSVYPKDEKVVKAKGGSLRVHFKNTYNVVQAIKGMSLKKALHYLNQCLEHKDIIPFRRFNGGVGRKALVNQPKYAGATQGRWPEKCIKAVIGLLRNAESNADVSGQDSETLIIQHAKTNRAPGLRRRTYRAHGRINPYMAHPVHVEIVCAPADVHVIRSRVRAPRVCFIVQCMHYCDECAIDV
jgi:large subunit ribosomal protein L17e